MEQSAGSRNSRFRLAPYWYVRASLAVLIFASFAAAVCTNAIHPYWLKVAAACACAGIWGFIGGLIHHSAPSRIRKTIVWSWILTPISLYVFSAAKMVGLHNNELDLAFLTHLLLFIAATLVSYLTGVVLFRLAFPERTPSTPSVEDER